VPEPSRIRWPAVALASAVVSAAELVTLTVVVPLATDG
jgi:hypothetical protein